MLQRLDDEARRLVQESRAIPAHLGRSELDPFDVLLWMIRDRSLTERAGLGDIPEAPLFTLDEPNERACREVSLGPGVIGAIALAARHSNPVTAPGLLQALAIVIKAECVTARVASAPAVDGSLQTARGGSVAVPVPRELLRYGWLLGEDDPSGGSALVGRDELLESCAAALLRPSCPNLLLVGEAGVGKTAVVVDLARRLLRDDPDLPARLRGCRIVALDPTRLKSGTTYHGDIERRVEAIIEAAASDPHVILFVDEFHALAGMGRTDHGRGYTILDAMKPHLASGRLRLIGATTEREYSQHVAADQALVRRFSMVRVPAPSGDALRRIVTERAALLARDLGVCVGADVLEGLTKLAAEHLSTDHEPARSLAVLEQAAALASLRAQEDSAAALTLEDVERALGARINAPVGPTSVDMQRLRASLSKVVGQSEATESLCDEVAAAIGLVAPRTGPRLAVLLTGPTGVGKTMAARALAEGIFGDTSRLLRFDLGGFYGAKHALAALLGTPPGYAGHEEGGRLTNALIAEPRCVLLLDNVDCAHPAVWDMLAQALTEGAIVDLRGRTASLRHCFVVMTATEEEVRARRMVGLLPSPVAAGGGSGADTATDTLPLELLDRLTAVIRFRPLDVETLASIARTQLDRIADGFGEGGRGVAIDDPDVFAARVADCAEAGSGAPGVIRMVSDLVTRPLSRAAAERQDLWTRCRQLRVTFAVSQDDRGVSWVELDDGSVLLSLAV